MEAVPQLHRRHISLYEELDECGWHIDRFQDFESLKICVCTCVGGKYIDSGIRGQSGVNGFIHCDVGCVNLMKVHYGETNM